MRTYRWLWRYGWGAVGVGCSALAPVLWPISTVAMLFVVGTATAGAVSYAYLSRDGVNASARGNLARRTLRRACLGGTGVMATAVVAEVAGSLLLPLFLLVAATSPWLVERVVRKFAGDPTVPQPLAATPTAESRSLPLRLPPAEQVGDDKELCRLWRASFRVLQATTHPRARLGVVALRQGYLDELERRDPSAVTAWLASGPRAAGGPERFLSRPEGEDFRQAS